MAMSYNSDRRAFVGDSNSPQGENGRRGAKKNGEDLVGASRWSRKSLMMSSSALTLVVFSLDLSIADWTSAAGYEMVFYALGLFIAGLYVMFAEKPKVATSAKQSAKAPSGKMEGHARERVQTRQALPRSNMKPWLPPKQEPSCPASALSTPVGNTAAGAEMPTDRASAICQVLATAGPIAAVRLLNQFEAEGWASDVSSYNRLMRAQAKRGDLLKAEELFDRLHSRGLQADEETYLNFIAANTRADSARIAESWMTRLLGTGLKPTTAPFGCLIDMYARQGNAARAADWLQRMTHFGLEPEANHYNCLIHVCTQKADVAGAVKVLQEMQRKNVQASVKTYTALVDVCAKALDVSGAEKWMEEMRRLEIEPNVVSYSAMINACSKVGDLKRAERWYAVMQERGVQANAFSYSALINACAQAGDVDAACSWLDRAEGGSVALDGVVYGCVINACGKVGDAERAMSVFGKMKAHGISSHIVVYGALARPFAYRGDWAEVERIRDMMLAEDGIKMNDYYLYTLLLAYSRAKPRQGPRAEEEFRKAMQSNIAPNDNLIKALGSAVGKARCEKLVAELCPNFTSKIDNAPRPHKRW